MTDAPTAYPLAWPRGVQRTQLGARKSGPFTVMKDADGYREHLPITVDEARRRLSDELGRLGGTGVTLSTNVEVRLDGQPRSGRRDPADPGVAVYFTLNGKPMAMPCDRYTTVAANIAAIAAHIEKVRAIERYGVASVEQMFTGFQALAAPGAVRPWRATLGFESDARPTAENIKLRHRALAMKHHPDRGGDPARMAEINAAVDRALADMGDVT